MSFLVTIYERRVGIGQLGWTTLGLGPATIDDRGVSPTLLKARFVHKLKAWIRKAKQRELTRLEQLPGIALERHRVSLEVKRVSATLSLPLIVEPRHTGVGPPLLIGYHPNLQRDFFVIDPERPRATQYRLFLEHALADTDPDDLRDLEARKDRLRTLVFDAEVPSLLDRVGPKRGAWWSDLRAEPKRPPGGDDDDDEDGDGARRSELERIATDLSERAAEDNLAIGLAREPFATQLRTLAQRGSVVVIGPPGAGKTTAIHRFVHERLHEDGYALHKSLERVRRIWSLSGRRILAGMKHHGDWEARVASLIDELARRRGSLVVPDLPAWALLGRTRDSQRNLAEVMRGPLERREVIIVGEATRDAWARLEELSPAFAAQFQQLVLPEPDDDEVLRIVLAAARRLEDGDCAFDAGTLHSVRLWSRFLYPSRAEPGRSLTLLEEASRLDEYAGDYELIEAVTDRAGVPGEIVAHRGTVPGFRPHELVALARHVVGQDEATAAMVDLLQRVRTGLTDPSRPWGVFLLTGPTGTGKTELAKGVAEHLYGSAERLLRIDMNQLTGPDAVHRLIGDAFHPDGRLTSPILDTPFQIVLLDELEKAHPSVLYLLLQLLDEGRLTDAAGRTADFRRAVILITSNLGAAPRPPLGFGGEPDASARRADTTRAVARALPPELFNRIDAVLAFQPLSHAVALEIAERQVVRLGARAGLRDRHANLTCTPAALAVIVREGFDPEYGARTVKRWIESHLTDVIATELVDLAAEGFKHVRVDAPDAADVAVTIEALTPARRDESLPYAYLLAGTATDADRPIDRMCDRLAAFQVRAAKDAPDERVVVAPADADEADRVYWRDQLQGAIAGTLKWLRRMRNIRRSPMRDVVKALSQASFLARVAPRVDEPIHRVTVRLSHPTRSPLRRLMPALVDALRQPPWEVEAFAKRLADGGRISRDPEAGDCDRVVLRLAGLGVRDALVPEVGSWVLDTVGEGLEVVAFEVLPPDETEGAAPEALLAADAVALGQQVRTIRFEAGKDARPYVLIDHARDHRESGHAADLGELVSWCLALGRSAEARAVADEEAP